MVVMADHDDTGGDVADGILAETRRQAMNADGAIESILAGGASGRDAQLLRAVFAQAGIGVGLSDMAGKILVVNTSFARMFGYEVEEFIKLHITDLNHPDDTSEVWEQYGALMRGDVERVSLEKPHLHRDGHTIWNSVNVSLIRDANGVPIHTLAFFEDVTDRHQLEQQLRHQALFDPLTGLPNRVQFFERLGAAFEDPHNRVGICYVDLDCFKDVNDTLGHDIGDKVLVMVADRLALCLQRPGQIVARLGGDEFVFFVPDPGSTNEVTELADSVLRVLESPFDVDGHMISISASLGVMEQEVAELSQVDLMKGADVTLARAKQAGRNRWALYDRDHDHTPISRALGRGEFFVLYQPIVRLTDNRMIGAEALLRWAHPTLGTLLPDRFINLAERNGMIVPLTTFVIEQACRDAAAWRERAIDDPPPFVSVNVSVRNICDAGFVSVVRSALHNTGLPPHALQLELTENALLGKDETSVTRLQQLSAMGVAIAIDDFGTGFSSLAYLRNLPVDVVKLAGEFIKNLAGNIHGRLADEQITRAMIDLAHTLGLSVTAEEVETPSQAARLLAFGCDAAQGWHFAKPMRAELIEP
jgi:diguanylate cyclase (GGDEF)-like protein/PAS domain S-box-containing protein